MKNKDKTENLKRGQKIAFIATFVTLSIAGIKLLVGIYFNSKLLVADAFHSGADLLAIFASGFGLWLASKKKSEKFPYGLYKAETLFSLLIGILISWAGVEILKDGYHKLFYIAQVKKNPIIPIITSIISIITAYFLAIKEKKVGRSINSQSLVANANESFLDIITSSVVLGGIVLSNLKIPYVEGSIIILVSLLVLKLGLENIWNSLLTLLDANLNPKLQEKIEKKVNEIYGVKGVGDVKIREAGPFKMVDCKIQTDATLPLYKAHELADKTEKDILKNYEYIESVFTHVEPAKEKVLTVIVPVKDINGLDSKVHGHFGRSQYFVILELKDNKTNIVDFYYNEFLEEEKHVGVKVIRTVIKYKLNILFTSRIGEISFHMLKDNFVDIYKVQEDDLVKDVIGKYNNGELEQMVSPTHPIEDSQSES